MGDGMFGVVEVKCNNTGSGKIEGGGCWGLSYKHARYPCLYGQQVALTCRNENSQSQNKPGNPWIFNVTKTDIKFTRKSNINESKPGTTVFAKVTCGVEAKKYGEEIPQKANLRVGIMKITREGTATPLVNAKGKTLKYKRNDNEWRGKIVMKLATEDFGNTTATRDKFTSCLICTARPDTSKANISNRWIAYKPLGDLCQFTEKEKEKLVGGQFGKRWEEYKAGDIMSDNISEINFFSD